MKETERELVAQRYALTMQRIMGEHICHHLDTARAAVTLILEMKKRVVPFSFVGQDGVTHKVQGTLTGYEACFGHPYQINPNNRFIVYYDVRLKGWRTFQITGLIQLTVNS